MDRAAGGEYARHEYDILDFEGQSVFCLIVEDGLGEGDEPIASGAAESNVGFEGTLFSWESVGLQGVL